MLKKCNRCQEELEISSFGKKPNTYDGYNSRCKKCISESRKESSKNRILADIKTKLCRGNCKQELPIENFTINKANKDGYSSMCSKCYSETRPDYVPKLTGSKYDINRAIKICKHCQVSKNVDEFHFTTNTLDGRENLCRECRLEQRKEFAKLNQEKINLGLISILEKKCKFCKQIRTIENFNKDSSRGDGYDTGCKSCNKLRFKAYSQTPLGKENMRIRTKKYKILHPDAQKIHYYLNKTAILKRIKHYILNTSAGRINHFKRTAKYRNLDYNLDIEFIDQYWNSSCHYCNEQLDTVRFDRINSNLGYLKDNVVPCCAICNLMKNDLSTFQFYQHIEQILQFQETKISNNYFLSRGEIKTMTDSYFSQDGKYTSYKKSADKRNIVFNLTFLEFISFWKKDCEYCGSKIETIGLDRFDNEIGYYIDNIKSCCYYCNSMKRDKNYNDFINHCQKIWKVHSK